MSDWLPAPQPGLYGWVTILGLLIGGWLWSRRWKSRPESFPVFVGAILGAFLGAKLLYLLAEGWMVFGDEFWVQQWLTGKTIVGALLGGYAGVEVAKKLVGLREPTGDWFAVGVPLAIAAGRLGCLQHGCCLGDPCPGPEWFVLTDPQGQDRWPAVPLELGFNLLFVAAILPLVLRKAGGGQLFHAYLVSYGLFRFWHEFQRATPELIAGVSGYQIGALALVGLGVWRGWMRWRTKGSGARKENPPAYRAGEAE